MGEDIFLDISRTVSEYIKHGKAIDSMAIGKSYFADLLERTNCKNKKEFLERLNKDGIVLKHIKIYRGHENSRNKK